MRRRLSWPDSEKIRNRIKKINKLAFFQRRVSSNINTKNNRKYSIYEGERPHLYPSIFALKLGFFPVFKKTAETQRPLNWNKKFFEALKYFSER